MIYETLLSLSRTVYEQDFLICNAFCYSVEELEAELLLLQSRIDSLELTVVSKANSLPYQQARILLDSLHNFR